jgi:hypothetical protein
MVFLRRERRQATCSRDVLLRRDHHQPKRPPHAGAGPLAPRRCNCENHIKELKHGFALASLPSGDFFVNAVSCAPWTLAFNLIASLKRTALPESWAAHTLKTLRFPAAGRARAGGAPRPPIQMRLSRKWPWRDIPSPIGLTETPARSPSTPPVCPNAQKGPLAAQNRRTMGLLSREKTDMPLQKAPHTLHKQ